MKNPLLTRVLGAVIVLSAMAFFQPDRVAQGFESNDTDDETGSVRGTSAGGIDLRPQFKERALSVRHQGKRGACQVFALLGVIEYQLSRTGKPLDLSEQFLMWAANDANGFDRTEGFYPGWLIKGLRKHGVCEEELMPYVDDNVTIAKPTGKAKADAARRKRWRVHEVKHWNTDVGYNEAHIQEIKEVLQDGEPLTATFRWAFGTPDQETYDDKYFYLDRNIRVDVGGHGVVILGYKMDDSVAGGGYFIIRNSWGNDFGEDGHVKVTFEFAKRHGIDAYRVKLQTAETERDEST